MNLDAFYHGYAPGFTAIHKSASDFKPPSLPLLKLTRKPPIEDLKEYLDKRVPKKESIRHLSPAAKKHQGITKGKDISPEAKRVWENYYRQRREQDPNYRKGVVRQIPRHSIEI